MDMHSTCQLDAILENICGVYWRRCKQHITSVSLRCFHIKQWLKSAEYVQEVAAYWSGKGRLTHHYWTASNQPSEYLINDNNMHGILHNNFLIKGQDQIITSRAGSKSSAQRTQIKKINKKNNHIWLRKGVFWLAFVQSSKQWLFFWSIKFLTLQTGIPWDQQSWLSEHLSGLQT